MVHYTDNQGVVSIFTKGSPKEGLQKMALDVFLSCNQLGIKIHFVWKPRDDPMMQLVDSGSRGPWPVLDDFTVDPNTAQCLISRGINLDGFASFDNKLCARYFSRGFQVEAAGVNFFTQRLLPSDVVLIHPHPSVLFDALLHASRFQCSCVVLMHIWPGYVHYRNLLCGGHLPSFCQNLTLVDVSFKARQPIPAFTGSRNFRSCIFNVDFNGLQDLVSMLSRCGDDDLILDKCLTSGCFLCLPSDN